MKLTLLEFGILVIVCLCIILLSVVEKNEPIETFDTPSLYQSRDCTKSTKYY